MAFVVGAVIFLVTAVFCVASAMGNMMSDNPDASLPVATPLVIGTVAAVLVAATHWLPPIGW